MRKLATAVPQRVSGKPSLVVTFPNSTQAFDDEAQLVRFLRTAGYTGVTVKWPKQIFCMCRSFHGKISIYVDEEDL